ncbi:MAG: riboflavin synthase [Bacillota bacterium]
MFTGIIEEKGTLTNVQSDQKSAKLTIQAEKVLKDTKIGDSIATNGVCLTVTDMTKSTFTVDVMFETLNSSTLSNLGKNDALNLERALRASDRLGGHMMSGHVDGIGTLVSKKDEGIATVFTFKTDPSITRYVTHKGSIGINGVSLTVVDVSETSFGVSVIPETKRETNLGDLNVGSTVNLEVDMIAKYVEKLLKPHKEKSTITENFLKENGYI